LANKSLFNNVNVKKGDESSLAMFSANASNKDKPLKEQEKKQVMPEVV